MKFPTRFWRRITRVGAEALGVTRTRVRAQKSDLPSSPRDMTWKGWKQSLEETWNAIRDKNIGMLSAGIAYFGVLAFFPLLAAVVACAGIVVSPDNVKETAADIGRFMPPDIYNLLVTQLENAAGHVANNATVFVVGMTLSILGVAGATSTLMNALNVMYEVKEKRSFLKQRITSIVLTMGLIVTMLVLVPLLFTGGNVLTWIGLPAVLIDIFSIARWALLAGLMMISLAVLYHFGPSRSTRIPWQWVSWGAIIATVLWVFVSAMFFIYLQYFADFSRSYSLFAGLIALMIWLNLSSFVVLLGAEVNHRLERRGL